MSFLKIKLRLCLRCPHRAAWLRHRRQASHRRPRRLRASQTHVSATLPRPRRRRAVASRRRAGARFHSRRKPSCCRTSSARRGCARTLGTAQPSRRACAKFGSRFARSLQRQKPPAPPRRCPTPQPARYAWSRSRTQRVRRSPPRPAFARFRGRAANT